MAAFYGWGSTASWRQSHFDEAVYFLPLVTRVTLKKKATEGRLDLNLL